MRSFPVGHPETFRGLATTAGCQSPLKLLPLPEPPVLDLTWAVASAKAKVVSHNIACQPKLPGEQWQQVTPPLTLFWGTQFG
jgi:hypothetical protein